jgi:hypothetical protein
MISSIIEKLEAKHNISISEGEPFKQAHYNNKLTDSPEQVRDKIELAIKHYTGKNLLIETCESDETSPTPFVYAVVIPVHD